MNRGFLPQKRHRAREMALQLLYALDLRRNQTPDQAFELFPSDEDPEIMEYARTLTNGAWERRMEIDDIIREHVVGWRPERMVAVDRAALRMSLFECLFAKSIPLAVSISEAVELAKTFGTEESGKFVNGVLGRIVRNLASESTGLSVPIASTAKGEQLNTLPESADTPENDSEPRGDGTNEDDADS